MTPNGFHGTTPTKGKSGTKHMQGDARGRTLTLLALTALMLVLCPALYFATRADGIFHLRDDQMIVLRVARVFWEHGVPYINPGEAVAANTSLFWPIILSPALGLTDDLYIAVRIVASGSILAWIAMSAWLANRQDTMFQMVVCLLILCLSTPALRYGGSGWEHVPQTLVVTIAIARFLREQHSTVPGRLKILYLLSLSFVFRPDSVPIVGMFFLVSFAQLGAQRWRFLLGSLPAALIPLGYLGLMYWFYGDFVPNTYYLKVVSTAENLANGLDYLMQPRQSGPVPIFWLGIALMWRRLSVPEKLFMVMALAQILSVIYLGGDYFRAGRLLLLLMPILTFILVRHGTAVIGRIPVGIATTLLILGPMVEPSGLQAKAARDARVISQVRLMQVVRATVTPEEGRIGLHDLGISYWLPGFEIIDFLGKADPVIARSPPRGKLIAHTKWDYDYALNKAPIAAIPFFDAKIKDLRGEPTAYSAFWGYQNAGAEAIYNDPRFDYLPPERFCFETVFGLFVRQDLTERFTNWEGRDCIDYRAR